MKLILILAILSLLPDFTLPQTLHGKVTTNEYYQQFNVYTSAESITDVFTLKNKKQ